MNIKETAKNIGREIADSFKGIDSNPEHIASFPAHLAECSRTKPLKLELNFIPLPSLYSANFRTELKSITCSECKGTQTFMKG